MSVPVAEDFERPLIVVASGANKAQPWELVGDRVCEVVRPMSGSIGLETERIDASRFSILDVTGAENPLEVLRAVPETVVRLLVVCSLRAFAELYSISLTRGWSLFVCSPILYSPAVLEFRRIIHSGEVGPLLDLDLDMAASEEEDPLLAIALLSRFFRPGLLSIEAEENSDGVVGAAVFKSGVTHVQISGVFSPRRLSGVASGGSGRVRFDTREPFLQVLPHAEGSRHAPLPEGGGLYYCMLHAIESARSGKPEVLPEGLLRAVVEDAGRLDAEAGEEAK